MREYLRRRIFGARSSEEQDANYGFQDTSDYDFQNGDVYDFN